MKKYKTIYNGAYMNREIPVHYNLYKLTNSLLVSLKMDVTLSKIQIY